MSGTASRLASLPLLLTFTSLAASCTPDSDKADIPAEIVLNCSGQESVWVSADLDGKRDRRRTEQKDETLTFRLNPVTKSIELWNFSVARFGPVCKNAPCLKTTKDVFNVNQTEQKHDENTVTTSVRIERRTGDIIYNTITTIPGKHNVILESYFSGKCVKGETIEAAALKF